MSKIEQLQAEGRKEFEDKTDGAEEKCPDDIHNANIWLREHSSEHLFENCVYNEPMFDLSAEKLLSFQDSLIARAFEEGRKSVIDSEIERKKGMRQPTDWSPDPDNYKTEGYNQAISEDLTHLEEIKSQLNPNV